MSKFEILVNISEYLWILCNNINIWYQEYNNHGEWVLTVLRCGGKEAGEYSVTAENRLGNSTRDWRLRVRPLPTAHQVTPLAPAPAPAPVPAPVKVASPSPSRTAEPAAPSSVEVEMKSCQTQQDQHSQARASRAKKAEAAPREKRPESESPRSGDDHAPPPG